MSKNWYDEGYTEEDKKRNHQEYLDLERKIKDEWYEDRKKQKEPSDYKPTVGDLFA